MLITTSVRRDRSVSDHQVYICHIDKIFMMHYCILVTPFVSNEIPKGDSSQNISDKIMSLKANSAGRKSNNFRKVINTHSKSHMAPANLIIDYKKINLDSPMNISRLQTTSLCIIVVVIIICQFLSLLNSLVSLKSFTPSPRMAIGVGHYS